MSTTKTLNGTLYEKNLIEAGFARLGIDGNYEIVTADNPDLVENTAAQELRKFILKVFVNANIVPESRSTGKKRFWLGRESNLKALKNFGDSGKLKIRDVSAEDDAFHLKQIGNNFVVAGANPRGVLYGVYAFEDFVRAGAKGNLDIKKIPCYRKRGGAPHYSFNRYVNLLTEDFPEEKAACLSRLGINQITDQGIGGWLHHLVKSDVFTFQDPPQPDFQRKIRAMSALCKKYGIDHYLWLTEPHIDKDFEKYPKEAIGTVRPPYGGDKDGLARTLCVNSPLVQEYLRNMMKKLAREYPDIKGVLFYNLDGPTWLCTPELCDRCKAVCKDSPPDTYMPWETQAKLITLLAEAAREENPDFDFKFWGAVHYHGERFDKMIRAARGYGSLVGCWNGSDRSIMIPDIAKPDPAFITSQKVCEERAIPMHMLLEFNNIESIPRSLPFPFHVCDALKKIKQWNVKNLTEIYGLIPEHNSINALVMKEFQWNPDQDPEKFLADLARRQFGKTAGKLMYRAWQEMEKAFDVWNDMLFGPLDGSQHCRNMGTAATIPYPVLPNIASFYKLVLQTLVNVEPWRAADYQKFKEKVCMDKMILMNTHFARAEKHARKAVAAASEKEFINVCHYEGTNGRPTCKEYAELNYAPIAIADALCRQRCNMFRAYHLPKEIENGRADAGKKSAQTREKLYFKLLREDIDTREYFYDLLTRFAAMRPCYLRASLTEREIANLLRDTRDNINSAKEFLEKKRAGK